MLKEKSTRPERKKNKKKKLLLLMNLTFLGLFCGLVVDEADEGKASGPEKLRHFITKQAPGEISQIDDK